MKKKFLPIAFVALLLYASVADATETWEKSTFGLSGEVNAIQSIWEKSTFGLSGTVRNAAPGLMNEQPTNGSVGQALVFVWNISIFDLNGRTLNWSIECSNGMSNSSNDDTNGSKELELSGLERETLYVVWVNVTNGLYDVSEWYTFTTVGLTETWEKETFGLSGSVIPYENWSGWWVMTLSSNGTILSSPVPTNGSLGVLRNISEISIDVNDPEGDLFNWTIECSNGDSDGGNDDGNGTKACAMVSALSNATTYYWWVNSTDGFSWTNETYHFRINGNPVNSAPYPANGAMGIETNPRLMTMIVDQDDSVQDMNVTFRTNASGTWQDIGYNASSSNGTYRQDAATMVTYGTRYWWSTNTTDDAGGWDNDTYWFETADSDPVQLTSIYPANGSIGILLTLVSLHVMLNDTEGASIDWTIECSNGDSDGGAGEPNGTKTCALVTPLASGTTYYWYVNATDGDSWSNETYHFRTNEIPVSSGISPANGSVGRPLNQQLSVTINDLDAGLMNITFSTNATGVWGDIGTNSSVGNGTYRWTNGSMDEYGTRYWWGTSTNDGMGGWENHTYHFDTLAGNPVAFGVPVPVNGSVGVSQALANIQIPVTDPDGDLISWIIECSNGDSNSAVGETNGTKACLLPTALAYSTLYYWYVNATDGESWTNATYHFTTQAPPGANNPVVFSSLVPPNGSGNISRSLAVLQVTMTDPDGDPIAWTIECSNGNSSSGAGSSSGIKTCQLSSLAHNTTYYWWVNATDGTDTTNAVYHFTTRLNEKPVLSDEHPVNGSENASKKISRWSLTIEDPDGDAFNWTIETSPDVGNSSGYYDTNGTKSVILSSLKENTVYTVFVNVSEDWVNGTFWFKTARTKISNGRTPLQDEQVEPEGDSNILFIASGFVLIAILAIIVFIWIFFFGNKKRIL